MLKILTLNTWQERGSWQERWKIILKGIKEMKPDLVGFQEIFNESWAYEVSRTSGLSHLYFPCQDSGLVTSCCSPFLRQNFMKMKTKSPTEEYFRYVSCAVIKIEKEELAFCNTHLSWRPEEGRFREKQVEELLAFVDEQAGDRPTIIVGDFNAPPHTPEIRKVIREGGFTDIYGSLYPGEKGYTWDNQNPYAAGASHELPDRRIDYIFVRNRGRLLNRILSCEIVFDQPRPDGIYATDHFGVLAAFGG